MIYVAPSTSFESVTDGFATGLAGTIGVRVRTSSGSDAIARTTSGIAEDIAGSGIYRVSLTAPATAGQYSIVWDDGSGHYSTDDLTVTTSAAIVTASGSNYITRAGLKATLGITVTDWDSDIDASITGACRAIDNLCQRRFYLDADATQVRYYSPVDPLRLEVDDIAVLTTLQSADDGTTTFANTWTLNTDFVLEPLNAAANTDVWPYTHFRVHPNGGFVFNTLYPRSVKVTAQFGWPAVPGPVVDATTLLAERLFKMKREAPLGVLAFMDVAMRIARADSNLMLSLGPYMRHRAAIG